MKFQIKDGSTNPTIEEQIVVESLRLLNKFLVNSAKNNPNFNSKTYQMTIHLRSGCYGVGFGANIYLKYIYNYNPTFSLRLGILTISNFGSQEEFLISDPNIFDKIITFFKFRLNIT